MKRTTITMPERTFERLEREAHRRRTSVSAIVRECVAAKFPVEAEEGPRAVPFAGVGASGGGYPGAADMDDYLAKHWVDDLMKDFD
jgi:Ribbon-helix-helix protein, copG family